MPLFLILRRSVVRPFLDCRNRRNPHRTASARSVAAPVGLLDRNCTINDKFLRQRAGRTFFSCYPEPARARPQVAAVNFASLVVLLAARPFVHPTLPVRAVQAGLSTAERRGGRRSQPRSPSLAASVRRRGLPFRLPPGASAIRTSSMALGCCVGSGWPLARELSRSLAEDLAGRCIVFGAPTPPTGRAAIGIGT